MTQKPLHFAAAFFFVIFPGSGSGQEFKTNGQAALSSEPSLRTGLAREEIEKIFGSPERRSRAQSDGSAQSNGVETWHYGNSIVFFDSGTVTAWSDEGELSQVSPLMEFGTSDQKKSTESFREQGWQNDWTREKPPSPAEVIENLVESTR